MKHTREPRIGTPVILDWIDSTTLAGWQYRERGFTFAPRKIRTIGYFMGSNPVAYYVVATLAPPDAEDSSEGHLDGIVIPRGCVTTLRELKL